MATSDRINAEHYLTCVNGAKHVGPGCLNILSNSAPDACRRKEKKRSKTHSKSVLNFWSFFRSGKNKATLSYEWTKKNTFFEDTGQVYGNRRLS